MKLSASLCAAILGLSPVWAARVGPSREGLSVHEWGTFTTVASPDGGSQEWQPLVEPPDLPCFVNRMSLSNIKILPARVRMETPVIYFYVQQPMPVSVRVDFPHGILTEWYPSAARAGVSLQWNADVQPDAQPAFPMEGRPSRYYAARETDAAPLRVGSQQEKLIFYRGIGGFGAPLTARFIGGNTLALGNTGKDPIPTAIVFMNRGGRVGWWRASPLGEAAVDTSSLAGDLAGLRTALEDLLTAQGLYLKEARAMLETWRDSWFEEGTRVLYIVPRSMVDDVLPLTLNPQPAELTRVFVGRVEVQAPWMQQEIASAVQADQPASIAKYGRFLLPFLGRQKLGTFMKQYVDSQFQRVFTHRNAAPCAP